MVVVNNTDNLTHLLVQARGFGQAALMLLNTNSHQHGTSGLAAGDPLGERARAAQLQLRVRHAAAMSAA